MDLTDTIAPKSDQANADDFVGGPRTFTITEVRKTGADDQPVAVYLAEFPSDRPFKPSLSMRRVMVAGWGKDASTYVGRRLTLYRDPNVKWGGQAVGGIRISHMSNLKKPLTVVLTETRGKRAPYVVQPLPDAPVPAPATSTDAASDSQRRKLTSLLKEAGIVDKETGLAYIADIVGHEIASTADLTAAEASKAIDQITAEKEPAEPTLPEGAGPVPTWGADK